MEKKKGQLWILNGPPCCGKTTWFQKQNFSNEKIKVFYFSEEIVLEVLKKDYPINFSSQEIQDKVFCYAVWALLSWPGCHVYIETSLLTKKERLRLLNKLNSFKDNFDINLISFNTSLEKCAEYNSNNFKYSALTLIDEYKKYEMPSREEYPYNKILVVTHKRTKR